LDETVPGPGTEPSTGEAGGIGGDERDGEEIVVYRPGMTMEELEVEAIRAALKESGGNRRKAAERLEIGERTLYRKIKKYRLEDS
jgi:transcriptional regulator with PAS, ATPase and Fis domain